MGAVLIVGQRLEAACGIQQFFFVFLLAAFIQQVDGGDIAAFILGAALGIQILARLVKIDGGIGEIAFGDQLIGVSVLGDLQLTGAVVIAGQLLVFFDSGLVIAVFHILSGHGV